MCALRVVYKCADGTDFPVDWDNPADAERSWASMRDHFSLPITPIEDSADVHITDYVRSAFEDAGLPVPPPIPVGQPFAVNLHRYGGPVGGGGGPRGTLASDQGPPEAMVQFVRSHRGPKGVWESYALPRVEATCDRLRAAPHDASPLTLLQDTFAAFGLTNFALQMIGGPVTALTAFLSHELDGDPMAIIMDLEQGFPHTTISADQAMWELAQLVKDSPALTAALRGDDPATVLQDEAFGDRFEAFMDVYGDRAQDWDVGSPTYRERPEVPLKMIDALLQSDAPSPDESLRLGAERRLAALESTTARLDGDEKRQQFRAMAAAIADTIPIVESRAHWQLTLCGLCRAALLRIGERLVREGVISKAQDVLFLRVPEVESPPQDAHHRVAGRRAEYEYWAGIVPPAVIGAPLPQDLPPLLIGAGIPRESTDARVVNGVAASKGRVTARARLLNDPLDGGRLSRGEVLVAPMTSPAWTPLFAVAGAVITETGGVLSHPAITAREYGIPCVVAAHGAMQRIEDGALVTVDGVAGTVTLAGT